jgi:hypothetical protein
VALTHPWWAADNRLLAASNDNPALGTNDSGAPVKLFQRALHELGYKLPQSIKHYNPSTGAPVFDGVYGMETVSRVIWFQKDFFLKPDGAAGRNTFAAMEDQLFKRGLLTAPSVSTVATKFLAWINIFIPGTIPGFTKPSLNPLFASVISDSTGLLPFLQHTSTIATAGRSFSSTAPSPSLMKIEMLIEFGTPTTAKFVLSPDRVFQLDNTTHLSVPGRSFPIMNLGKGCSLLSHGPTFAVVDVNISLSNPFGPGFPGTIDLFGIMRFDQAGVVAIDLKFDDFPAFESYLEHDGKRATLFKIGVPPGIGPKDLQKPPAKTLKTMVPV